MRFLVDECVGPFVVRWLCENNHDATSAYEDCRGWEDESILEKAYSEGRIVVNMDKDFGDMVFRRASRRAASSGLQPRGGGPNAEKLDEGPCRRGEWR